ncbi:hypothetical protein ERO13_D09G181766v2 [Gossypium hirsutum]|uniref:Uncharacterized protein n=3 Tax=Gossypium TaxID=3633 RepID=A0A0D2NVU1_GOSRA|nr:hypothetical protein ERO13_D09G181766v2 [Gossypium hirsutum]KJB37422.1 hypothetical protein B456_006G203700 [Gossypium raimondii]TYH55126.1 hypothetical protein ES332_D09G216400v1 [Gossypium tomentosum]
MASTTVYAAIPAVAIAAAGIYSFARHSEAKEFGGAGTRWSIGSTPAKRNQKVKDTPPPPKVAPQFDGLNCFETFVG